MTDRAGTEGPEPDEKQIQEQLEHLQLAQQAYLEHTFKWLIEYIASYFPEDSLAMEDAMTDVHFIHTVAEGGNPLGALIYRFRKALDKKAYFSEIEEEYREGLGVPEVLFVDSETAAFEPPQAVPGEGNLVEIPQDKLTGKIRELRDELKKRAKMRQLKDSL